MKSIARRRAAALFTALMTAAALVGVMAPAYGDEWTGPVPANCVKFESGEIATRSPDSFPDVNISLMSWNPNSQEASGFTFSVAGLAYNQDVRPYIKSGQDQDEGSAYGNGTHVVTGPSDHAISHVTFCVIEDPYTTTTEPEDTTTTTEPEDTTTTTEPEDTTTTTEPEDTTTTTEPEDTTTTTEPEDTTTTTEPEDTTTTTEPEDTTTTTEPEDTTTTTQPEAEEESTTTTTPEEVLSTTTSTTVAADADSTTTSAPVSTLPFTGTDTDTMGLVALAALMAGTGLVGLTRKSAESRETQRS